MEAFTITVVLNDNGSDDLPSIRELIDGIHEGLHRDWFSAYQGANYTIHGMYPDTDVTCDQCIVIVDVDEQNHEFDALLCTLHRLEAQDERKAEQHQRDSER